MTNPDLSLAQLPDELKCMIFGKLDNGSIKSLALTGKAISGAARETLKRQYVQLYIPIRHEYMQEAIVKEWNHPYFKRGTLDVKALFSGLKNTQLDYWRNSIFYTEEPEAIKHLPDITLLVKFSGIVHLQIDKEKIDKLFEKINIKEKLNGKEENKTYYRLKSEIDITLGEYVTKISYIAKDRTQSGTYYHNAALAVKSGYYEWLPWNGIDNLLAKERKFLELMKQAKESFFAELQRKYVENFRYCMNDYRNNAVYNELFTQLTLLIQDHFSEPDLTKRVQDESAFQAKCLIEIKKAENAIIKSDNEERWYAIKKTIILAVVTLGIGYLILATINYINCKNWLFFMSKPLPNETLKKIETDFNAACNTYLNRNYVNHRI